MSKISVANATSLLTQEDKRLGKKGEYEMSSKSEKKSNRYCDWYEKATGENKKEHVAKVIFDSLNNSSAGCVYCKGLESQEEEGTEVCIDDYFLVVSHECLESGRYTEKKFEISYCPYCGRKL